MLLTQRENNILKKTIEDFISFGAPISSQRLHSCYFNQFSTATIRNSLANLEKIGMLKSIHRSSGKVPTDNGYRYYVDTLIAESSKTIQEYDNISQKLSAASNNLEDLLQATAYMLGKISRLFGIVVISKHQKNILNEIELIHLSSDRIMLVLGLNSGFIRSIVLNLKVSIDDSVLKVINQGLKDRLTGLTLDEIQESIKERLKESQYFEHEIVQILVQDPIKHFVISGQKLVYTSSFYQLLDYPEFHEINKLKTLMSFFYEKSLEEYLNNYLSDDHNNVIIGREIGDSNFRNCSIVSKPFENNNINGQMLVLGPKRLPYKDIKIILTNFTDIINNVI
ncbi:MAG: heat-inducible transcription repressor HrcA [Candidatus Marinimicrobia bacterium]|nr:heat-inducible transcription repressor HrcA [Candidatus Neomarinimicrobiota bacterium]